MMNIYKKRILKSIFNKNKNKLFKIYKKITTKNSDSNISHIS